VRWREAPALPVIVSGAIGIALLLCWMTRILPETLAIPPAFAALLLALALTSDRRGNPLEIAPLHFLDHRGRGAATGQVQMDPARPFGIKHGLQNPRLRNRAFHLRDLGHHRCHNLSSLHLTDARAPL